MKLDSYSFKGRIIPALLSIILPVTIFNHFYIGEELSKFINDVFAIKFISNLTISVVALYFLSEVGRFLGKNIFERIYFKEEKHMPTTQFLLFSDSQYSKSHKNKIRKKIKQDFNVSLPSESEENKNMEDARTRIIEVMSLIRNKLHNNNFLFKHNVEYGAARNIMGGSIVGCLISLFNIIFFYKIYPIKLAVIISMLTLLVYLTLIVFSRKIIDFYGKSYAKILYREYLSN